MQAETLVFESTHAEVAPNSLQEYAKQLGTQALHITFDPMTHLTGIIAIHSTQLGPSFGGCRCLPYPSIEAAAKDAMRLAQGMSYKNAIAGLPIGCLLYTSPSP